MVVGFVLMQRGEKMDDLIRRQAVIKALSDFFIVGFYDKATVKGTIGIIKELPSAQQWIPVTERLPENTEPVNITWVNRNPVPYYADIKDKPFTATGHYCNGRWWWFSAICQDYLDEYGECKMDEMDGDIEVIAWMPLPEPYKEERE